MMIYLIRFIVTYLPRAFMDYMINVV